MNFYFCMDVKGEICLLVRVLTYTLCMFIIYHVHPVVLCMCIHFVCSIYSKDQFES